ncbi:MAG: efflux RND transporter periplasmic adaptor subunit [Deltaproteobacteria bacterium]|nr:efflux RND transporter periplasmic adaptor subunit [Deltaproteobacteria bacterium]
MIDKKRPWRLFRAAVLTVLAAWAGPGCGKAADPAPAGPTAAPMGVASAAVRWVPARPASDLSLFDVPAIVRSSPQAAAVITPPVRARLLDMPVQAGDHVTAGQVIALVQLPELVQAAATLRSCAERQSAYKRWLAELRTQRSLGMARSSDVFDVESKLADLVAVQVAAEAQFRAAGLSLADAHRLGRDGSWPLRSPSDGVVHSVDGAIGAVIEPGTALARIVTPQAGRVEVRLVQALPDHGQLQFVAADGTAVDLQATPTATAVDPSDGALLAWYEAKQPQPLPTGLRGRLRVAGLPGHVVQIPTRALLRRDAKAWVIAQNGEKQRELAVTVLAIVGPLALVEGLPPGTRVAAEADHATLPADSSGTDKGE